MLTGERSLGGSDGAEAVGGEHAGRAGLTRRFLKKNAAEHAWWDKRHV
jgi:hypothetical protein